MDALPPSFEAKASHGVLANYCQRCGEHLSAHGTLWVPAMGSIRVCPTDGAGALRGAASKGNASAGGLPTPTSSVFSPDVRQPHPGLAERVPTASQVAPFGTENHLPLCETQRRVRQAAPAPVGDHLSGASCEANDASDGEGRPLDRASSRLQFSKARALTSRFTGGGLTYSDAPQDEQESGNGAPGTRVIPCRRSNESHLRGAAIERVVHALPAAQPRQRHT